jgi:hypothetical protein
MQTEFTIDWLVQKYLRFFDKFGMTEEDIRTHYEEWKEKSENDSVKDYLWYLFQVLLGETAKQINNDADFHKNNFEIYSRMWELRVLIEEKKDNQLVRLREESRVMGEAASLPFVVEAQVISGHCCPYCDDLDQKTFAVEEVLRNHFIGSNECTREWGCNCRYQTVPKWDAEGNAILRD